MERKITMHGEAGLIGLPKWPQMRVHGRGITQEQAREIIIRTDGFFSSHGRGGNNHAFEQRMATALGLPYNDYSRDADWRAINDAWEAFRASIGHISTEYVSNGWISNAFVFGPSGWCHPNGTIHFVHNVGKWPSVEAIADDWADIAAEWPFLDLDACLMSGEGAEDGTTPLVNIVVRDGTVSVYEHDAMPVLSRFDDTGTSFGQPDIGVAMMRIMTGASRENHFTVDEVVEMVREVRQRRMVQEPAG